MKKIILLLISLVFMSSYAQDKKLWAKSIINEKAPKLVVEKWLSDKPNTDGKFILTQVSHPENIDFAKG